MKVCYSIIMVLLLAACEKKINQASLADLPLGQQLYKQQCQTCHGVDGNGVANVFPPLANSSYIADDSEQLVWVILHGLSGEITVNGVIYRGVMPAQRQLSDQQVQEVAAYVLTAWGEQGQAPSIERIAEIRAQSRN